MTHLPEAGLDFMVDKLTNSIENIVTGDSFVTDIAVFTPKDLKAEHLDVDSIGGHGSLTPEEEKALSSYFLQRKQERIASGKTARNRRPRKAA